MVLTGPCPMTIKLNFAFDVIIHSVGLQIPHAMIIRDYTVKRFITIRFLVVFIVCVPANVLVLVNSMTRKKCPPEKRTVEIPRHLLRGM
ncbi:hypothetical protein Mapa_000488 [Marchantia paleacea]|nr:hypothetical protein Mapa_000488 [Marchantia paleacea]